VASSLLWENAEYALGICVSNKPDRVAKQHLAFRQRIQALPENLRADTGVLAVIRFLDNLQANLAVLQAANVWDEITTTNPNLAFALVGETGLICQRPVIIDAAATLVVSKGSARGQCLVSGNEDDIARIHIKISGVRDPGGQALKPLVSVNDSELPALASYGKSAAFNSPVGLGAVFAYATALNALLDRESRNRVQVGDASTVFWADAPHPFDGDFTLADLFGEADNPDRSRDAVRALYAAARAGALPAEQADTRFFVLGLSPNAARISIRFWLPRLRFAELAPRLVQHFDDIRVARRFDSDPETPSLFRLLTSLALQGKADNIPPRLAGEWMRAILEGLPLPAGLLSLAVQRDRASTAKERKEHPAYTYLRACVLKAWLNRRARATSSTSPTFKEALDMDNPAPAYRLGRLFATLERIQEQAQPGINATIRDRYYGAASTTPVAVFTTLLRLKNAHLKKLSAGFTAYFEKLIGDILAPLDPVNGFPRQLSLPEQGQFALGYYHQRQAFFTRKTDADTSTDQPQGD
jgi:CRISPR-associated protein Csd1